MHLFLLNLLRNLSCLPLTDSLDLRKSVRFLLDNSKRIVPEMPHDAGGQRRADSLDRTGTQIALHRGSILGSNHLEALYLKLLPVNRVLDVSSLRLNALTLVEIGKNTGTGNLHLLHLKIDHPVTVLCIFEYNMLDKPLQFFQTYVPPHYKSRPVLSNKVDFCQSSESAPGCTTPMP